MALTRCTDMLGYTTLLDADPMIETYADVLCVPAGIENTAPGIFDRGRKLVSAAGYFRASPDPVRHAPRRGLIHRDPNRTVRGNGGERATPPARARGGRGAGTSSPAASRVPR